MEMHSVWSAWSLASWQPKWEQKITTTSEPTKLTKDIKKYLGGWPVFLLQQPFKHIPHMPIPWPSGHLAIRHSLRPKTVDPGPVLRLSKQSLKQGLPGPNLQQPRLNEVCWKAWNRGFGGVRKKTPELPSFLDDDQQICLNQIVGRFSLNERFSRLRSPGRCRSPARLPDSQSIWSLQPVPPIFSCRQNYPGGAVIKTLGAGIPRVILVL